MSALGQKQTLRCILVMSALPPESGHRLTASESLLCANNGSGAAEGRHRTFPPQKSSWHKACGCGVLAMRVGRIFHMASPQRLLLHALLSGLGDAVGRNDETAADRYHTRIRLIARQHFDTNPSISDALERLLSASGRWLETNVAERSEAEQPVLKHIERVTELL